ncbi:MAG: hypothetical protein PPP58_09815 [Natronomonas sp.]
MPPTLLSIAIGIFLGCALLGAAFDRRSIAIVSLAAAAPDLDAVLSLVVPGVTNAALHNLFVPAVAAVALYWESTRDGSVLRRRYGGYGVRVAWVSLAAYLVAGIGVDLFSAEGVALLYPVVDTFYGVTGKMVYSTQEGLIETYFAWGDPIGIYQAGTVGDHHVATWVNPTAGTENPGERRIQLVESGPDAVIVVGSIATLATRAARDRRRRGGAD